MTRILQRLSIATAVLIVPLLEPIADAAHAAPACGSTVNTSIVLDANIAGCTNNGLVAGADNITIDLAGHTIACVDGVRGDGAGVLLQGRTGVTVKNGALTNCDAGVPLEAGTANTLIGVHTFNHLGGNPTRQTNVN